MEPAGDFTSNVAEEIILKMEPIINELRPKWREIGESLGLEAELPQFNHGDDEGHLLHQVITKWVERSLGINMWPPLLDALSNETDSNIISDLREQYSRVVDTGDGTDEDESELEDADNHRDIEAVMRRRCQCFNAAGWHDFKLKWIDPALTVLLLAIGIYAYLSIGEMDELDRYMTDHPLDSDKWQEISARPIRILVTGKTGTGKSALINGLIGKQMAEEGDTLKPQTSKVQEFKRMVRGVPMEVFDSPGLQDGTDNEGEYIQEMGEKCKDVDLVLYTIKMSDTRMHNESDDVRAMRQLTVAFREGFWSKAMFVMTFANQVQVPADPGQNDYERNFENFEKKLRQWSEQLPEILSNTLGVSSDIVNKVPIVPAGHYNVRDLPGYRFWFSQFWKAVIDRMKETSEVRTRFMLEYSKERWQKVYESSEDDLSATIDKQPIYKQPGRKGWFS